MHTAGIRITRVGTTRDRLGEGPIWDAETQAVWLYLVLVQRAAGSRGG